MYKEIDKDLFPAYKPVGISPYDLIKALKDRCPELRNQKIAYAGRLDPMAEGVVLLVKGEELKNFHDHLNYGKEYLAEILFGFSTDSYDLLGLPEYNYKELSKKEIRKTLKSFEGIYNFQLPPFSGYNLKGKPLFKWALEDRLDEVEIPEKKVEIYKLSVQEIGEIGKLELKEKINIKIKNVSGDFRQEKILNEWNRLLTGKKIKSKYSVAKIKIVCSSGCYLRSIAHQAGQKLSAGGLLLSLKRTKVGEWTIANSVSVFD